MSNEQKNKLNEEYDFQAFTDFTPQLIRRQSTYHVRSISQIDDIRKGEKKEKSSNNNFELALKIKIKKVPTGLRNIYDNDHGNGNINNNGLNSNNNDYLPSSHREKLPRSILKKKYSNKDTSSKGISFTVFSSNAIRNSKEFKEIKENNKGEMKTVSFGQESDHLITIYEPKHSTAEDEARIKDEAKEKALCKCDCCIY